MNGYTYAVAPTQDELAACAAIWLESSLLAHAFIDASFWQSNLAAMREDYLPAADIHMVKKDGIILGFAALSGTTLAALFSMPLHWGTGAGTFLMHHLQSLHTELQLTVYAKNGRGVRFYKKHGFIVQCEHVCCHTGEPELVMKWQANGEEGFMRG